MSNWVEAAKWSDVPDGEPFGASVEGVDLVVVRRGDQHSVLHGRCLHRGALLADGHIVGEDLICGLHGWDYRIESGVSAYNNAEALAQFSSKLDGDVLSVDRDELIRWKLHHPQPYSPGRVPGALHGSARHDRRAVRHADSRTRGRTVWRRSVTTVLSPRWVFRAKAAGLGFDINFVTAQLQRLPLA